MYLLCACNVTSLLPKYLFGSGKLQVIFKHPYFCVLSGNDYKTSHSSQLYGVNHISITTMDINRTLDFYVNQLGGSLVEDIQPSNLQSESLVLDEKIPRKSMALRMSSILVSTKAPFVTNLIFGSVLVDLSSENVFEQLALMIATLIYTSIARNLILEVRVQRIL